MGLRTTGVLSVGENLVVGSVGVNKPVMVIDAQGVVRQATATIEVAAKTMDILIKDLKAPATRATRNRPPANRTWLVVVASDVGHQLVTQVRNRCEDAVDVHDKQWLTA
jgi:hypothetical protein